MKVAVSWSGGKESCLAFHKAMVNGFKISYILNFVSSEGRCMSHGLDSKLIDAQSKAIETPIVQWKTTWDTLPIPILKKRIKILESGRMFRDGYWYLDIKRYEIAMKKKG